MNTQLFVTDHGDPSVGIPELTWVIDCPVFINNDHNISEDELEALEYFRKGMIEVFKEFTDGKLTADYDFETILDED